VSIGPAPAATPVETWRCFLAVPIPEELRSALSALVAEWRGDSDAPRLRWTDPAGWHVTLAFLGSVPVAQLAKIEAALHPRVATLPPFELTTGGLGVFPSPGSARVLWYAVADPDRRLAQVAAAIRQGLALEEERSQFRPHLTLARSGDRFGGPRLTDWLEDRSTPSGRLRVEQVVMYRSRLGPGPARYEALFAVPLGGAHD
jgi:2'-5' RNA ligase